FGIAQMPVVQSTYWNMVHGNAPEQIKQDLEGMQTMRNIGANMAWMLKCIQSGRQLGITPPQADKSAWTNFIR
ncbi:MAG: flavodoxin family protein, partial [Clostridia bacterium]|nr:flavodoxin family protein [Clostridia bacterium]